ncbi:MAG: hypothetical protein WCI39_06995 [Gallionellaceae bacterium]
MFFKYPAWSQTIRNHYWHLRFARCFHEARRRKEYRRIQDEKKRLQFEGVDSEAVRLMCRHLVNLKNDRAEKRLVEYLKTLQ